MVPGEFVRWGGEALRWAFELRANLPSRKQIYPKHVPIDSLSPSEPAPQHQSMVSAAIPLTLPSSLESPIPANLLYSTSFLRPTLTGGFSVNLNGPLILSPYFGSDYPAPPGDFTGLLHTGDTRLFTYSNTGMPIYYFLDATPKAATTPEPSTLILLLTGAGGLLATRRRALRVQ